MNRTYTGPIIDDEVEQGIVWENGDMYVNALWALGVDSGTGELVLLGAYIGTGNGYYVSCRNPPFIDFPTNLLLDWIETEV